jgi:metal-responsive CopG/Arc/MetJ family transcriptional regulator
MTLDRLTISIPGTLKRRVKVAAALRQETVSDVVRKALEDYVARTLDEQDPENERDFAMLLAPPEPDAMPEDEAIDLAVRVVREIRNSQRAK